MHRSSSTLHSSASISERKFAEKLSILNERGQGILTRVYNIKKVGYLCICLPVCVCECFACTHARVNSDL